MYNVHPKGSISFALKLGQNWQEWFAEIPCEMALSRTVKEIDPNLCFSIFGKNSKIQNGRQF